MKMRILAVLFVVGICLQNVAAATPGVAETKGIAKEAFIYAYPMLYNYQTLYEHTQNKDSGSYIGGFGKFRHYTKTYTPLDTNIVTPNNDTPYSWAWLDLRSEPWVLSVPALPKDRYNVFQWFDLYTHNFAYVGVRATGYDAGNYMFAGPNWHGEKPKGITKVFRSETDFIGTLTRTGTNGSVEELQKQYILKPLSAFEGTPAPPAAPAVNWIPWDEKRALSADFLSYLNFLLQFTKPHPSEKALMERFAKIGIEPGKPFDLASLDKKTRDAIEAGVQEGLALLKDKTAKNTSSSGLFGTREFLKNDYIKRAVGVMIGIYGNSLEEAFYTSPQVDTEGNPLTGKNRYALRFEKGHLPPVNLFWSITMYKLPERLLVDNLIDRYSIGDRTEGLKLAKDGSLTIYIQHEPTKGDKKANWLPAPDGPFFMVGRFYGPKPELMDGSYEMPPPERIK
ncbi:MAG TPA: DUF1254 domain-containing protein [Desulfobulbaceae bacterium]|nr:DUF1254 domain-containing protein [Desulfobulbaceae bacterium]